MYFKKMTIKTSSGLEFIDITRRIKDAILESKVKNGICVIYVPHTTAAITINDNADPSVVRDIQRHLCKLIPQKGEYEHLEGNADAHIKSSVVSVSTTLIISDGELLLGKWQGIFFCEFDGPRTREIYVKIIEG